jgi:hypothetical protein
VDEAKHTTDPLLLARARLALGIHLHHDGAIHAARVVLVRAAAGLPKGEAEHMLARAHVDALDAGVPCPCRASTHAA